MAARQQDSAPGSGSPAHPADPIDLQESVAGEEDPGASIDVPASAPTAVANACPRCGGSGRLGASACPECGGTGKVNVGIGGA
jgi:hypothetical protein